ncbi:MAG: hypothetical protein JSS35_00285, partial [Proteobacteria bacterium]|nr:hypothetical protein [Pseudomonadota bacterium]
GATEGIFLRVADNFPAKFTNVTITGNTAIGTMYDGITVLGGQNVDISGNNLVTQDMSSRVWVGNSSNVTVANNQAGAFIYGSSTDVSFTATHTNTQITTSNDVVTTATTDMGAHAIAQFGATHSIALGAGLDSHISVADLASIASKGLSAVSSTVGTSVGALTGVATGLGGAGVSLASAAGGSGNIALAAGTSPVQEVSVIGAIKNFYPYIAPISVGSTHSVTGGAGNDNLVGTSANDAISGGGGADTMSGGAGDDTYTVDNASDKVIESLNAGVDTVRSLIQSYTLPSNVEDLQLRGSGVQTGIGNELNNYLVANSSSSSVLNGMAGNDVLVAGHGADTLTGGAGADVFTFVYMPTSSGGVVTDFQPGSDVLDLRGIFRNVIGYHGNNPIEDGHLILSSDGHGGA